MKRLLVFIVINLFIITACTKPDVLEHSGIKIEDEKPLSGGQLNIVCVEPIDFNPINITNKSYLDIISLIFNGLFEYDKDNKIVPVLAKDIDIDVEKGKCTICLKDNIYWSDGSRLTTEDLKFTLDAIKKNPDSIYKETILSIKNYKAEDEEKFIINFNKPFFNILDKLCFPVIPKHVYSLNSNSLPIGTGPYKIKNYKRLKHMELEPNDFFWRSKKPYINTIKAVFVDDANAFDAFFQTGEIDILHASSYDWEKYKEQKDINTYKYISDSFEFILVNHKNDLLMDKDIRQALMYSINRRAILDKHLLSHAALSDTPIKPGLWIDDGLEIKYNFSKSEAQYILNNAGFSYNNESKTFERDFNGEKQELRLRLSVSLENNFRIKVAEDIKKYFEEVGFIIDLEISPFEDIEKAIEKGDFDLVLTGVNIHQGIAQLLYSTQPIGKMNYGSYSNINVDYLLDNIITKQKNPNLLIYDYKNIQEIIRDDLPILSLFFKENALVARSKVKGIIEPDSTNIFRTIGDWYIATESLE